MTEEAQMGGAGGRDTGEPIELLAEWGEPAPADLMERVRASIDRRETTAAAAELTLRGVLAVFLELVRVLFGLFERPHRHDQEEGEWDGRSGNSSV